jgi:hypothetical protein
MCVLAPRVTPPAVAPFRPPANASELLREAIRDLATSPYEQVRFVRATLRRFRPEPAPPAPVATHRSRPVLRVDDLKAVRDLYGG